MLYFIVFEKATAGKLSGTIQVDTIARKPPKKVLSIFNLCLVWGFPPSSQKAPKSVGPLRGQWNVTLPLADQPYVWLRHGSPALAIEVAHGHHFDVVPWPDSTTVW